MKKLNHITEIKSLLDNNPGISPRESSLWQNLAQKSPAEEQETIYNFLSHSLHSIGTDYYEILKENNLLERLQERFIEAQLILRPEEEANKIILTAALQEIIETNKEAPSISIEDLKKIEVKILKKVKTDDDLLRLITVLGPDGIQDMEESLIEHFINKKTDFSIYELMEKLKDLTKMKNVLTDKNIQYMQDTVDIYTKGLQWMNTQKESANQRASLYLDNIIKK